MRGKQIEIELLAPAKDLATGKEAILHGADAVYIGAPSHGARSAASNTIDDIKELAGFAHSFNAKVYATVNTIIYDDEIEGVRAMIHALYDAGADAIIVQDLGITGMDLPPIALHASTQMDIRTPAKAKLLESAGFSQIVLARELGLGQIAEIAGSTRSAVEVFVHGALCTSYSGQCYISHRCFGRSANRGECAQFCRLPLTLKDATGKTIAKDRHLLSLKDMNRSGFLEQLLDAGARSLKIEGRLKDCNYVKNVTAYYRKALDALFERRPEYTRSSSGTTSLAFVPDLGKSFNRGFTGYFFENGRSHIWSFDTPKSLGQEVGTVEWAGRRSLTVRTGMEIRNGDGLCFVNRQGELEGFRVNRAEGNEVFPLKMPRIIAGTKLYRNYDKEFNKMLERNSATRNIDLNITLSENAFGYTLSGIDEDGNMAAITFEHPKEEAKTPQREATVNQLSKLGGTLFAATSVDISLSRDYFIPSSLLSSARRKLVDAMTSSRRINYRRCYRAKGGTSVVPTTVQRDTSCHDNISNVLAKAFYEKLGAKVIKPAYELSPQEGARLMTCKHCIKHALGYCSKEGNEMPYQEPLSIVMQNGKSFRLVFDCKACEMSVVDE